MKTMHALLAAVFAGTVPAYGQTFINLDFEQAVIVPTAPTTHQVLWSAAAPGWRFENSSDTTSIYHASSHVGLTPFHVLVDREAEYGFNQPLAGRFSLAFKSGNTDAQDPQSPWIHSYIAQTGELPQDARSIRLLATGAFQLYFDDQLIPTIAVGDQEWAGDLSGLAGRSGELRIVNAADEHAVLTVDTIAFSTAPVPEPAESALLALGLGALAARRLRLRRKNSGSGRSIRGD